MSEHRDRIEAAFTQQAAAFEDPHYNRIFTEDVKWLFEHLRARPDDLVLDVAAGTGHVARALAPFVRAVIALDATEAMLRTGKAEADEVALRNVVFQRGDADALPFLDATFDVVVCRFAMHHFEAPAGPLAEMVRVLRPGGRLVVADLLADEDAAVAAEQDRLERLRDPSHVRLLAADEIGVLMREAGLASVTADARDIERALGPWLRQSAAPAAVADEVTAALRAEVEGGRATGLRPFEADGELRFVHRFGALTGHRPGE
jgi:ubiquinone/menaquinone biosynthesis C-methylase UbiE